MSTIGLIVHHQVRKQLISQLEAIERKLEEKPGCPELVHEWVLLDHKLISLNRKIIGCQPCKL
jgi:hypothetical protein